MVTPERLHDHLCESVEQCQQLLHVLLRVLGRDLEGSSRTTNEIPQYRPTAHGGDDVGVGLHVVQSTLDDVGLQVPQHGVHSSWDTVHEGKHQVQFWRKENTESL